MVQTIYKQSVNVLVVSSRHRFDSWLKPLGAAAQGNITTITHSGIRYHFTQCSRLDIASRLLPMLRSDVIVVQQQPSHKVYDFIAKIRGLEKQRHTGLIACGTSEQYDEKEAVQFLDSGADDYVYCGIGSHEILARIKSLFRMKSTADELRRANFQLKQLSLTDELTGLHNMRSFQSHYQSMLKRTRMSSGQGLAILMLDLDHFKFVNDSSNHLVGSYVLSEVGRLIKNSAILPESSIPARFGGDEYVIAIHTDDIAAVEEIARRLQDLIARTVFRKDGYVIQVSISIGYAWLPAGYLGAEESPIKIADLMLYESKKQGRNLVTGHCLGNTVDLDHVRRPHLVNGQASSDYHRISRVYNV